jgi:REP-associated tyrosine transposase
VLIVNTVIRCLVEGEPKSNLSKCINAYKSASSRLIKKEFSDIKRELWKEYFWSRSFCVMTVGGAPLEVIKRYIETQGMQEAYNKGYKYRLSPNKGQKVLLGKTFGCIRFI